MNDIRQWIPILIQLLTTVVLVVWFFAKLDKRIDMMNQKMDLKFDELGKDVKEIKDNHLVHLSADVKCLDNKLNQHLIDHQKK